GVRARQTEDALLMEKRMLEKAVQQTKKTVDFYDYKAGKIEDQLKGYSDHIQRLAEDRVQNAAALENTQRRLSDVRKSSQQLMGTLDDRRGGLAQLQIELEKERWLSRNATISSAVLVYKELLRRVTVSAQFVLQALGLMTSNPYTSDQKFQVMLPGFDSMVPFEHALVHPG
ncbi:hypothetical protein Sango_0194700, partial [Sesamum angolense]